VAGRQEGDPAQQAEDEQLRERVQAGLARLEDGYRAVVLLRDVEGLDYQAIAETLEISRAAVKSRLHRARLDLARILRDLRPEGAARTVK
jgi:RNA polymerase sigma-70 factor (ECF subfamily)